MDKEKNIKNYSHYLWIFISINFILYMTIILKKDFNFINQTYKNFILKQGLFAGVSTLVTFIINGFLNSKVKTILVFRKKEDYYPGCRVFTELVDEDDRIDKSLLKSKYNKLPTDPSSQNKLWYSIFKKYEFDPMIFDSHRNFLLSRDLTGLSFIFLIIYSLAAIISVFLYNVSIKWLFFYIVFLILQYIILSLVSRNYGERFSCNVIAKECSNIK